MRDIDIHWRGYPHHLPKVRFYGRRKPVEPISSTDGAGSSKGKDTNAKAASKLRPVADIPVYWRSGRPSLNSDRLSISSAREPFAVAPAANPASSEQNYYSTAPAHATVRTYDPRIAPKPSSKFTRPIKSAATQLGPFKPNVTRYHGNRGRTSGKSSRQSLQSISRRSTKSRSRRSRRSAAPSVQSIIKSVLSEAPSQTPSQRKALDQFTKDLASYAQKTQRSPKKALAASPTVTTVSAHTIRELEPYQAQFKLAGLAVNSADQRGIPKSAKIAIRASLPGRDDIRYGQSRDSRFKSYVVPHEGARNMKVTKKPKEPSYASGSTGTTVIGFTPPHQKSYPRAHRPRKASSLSSDHTIIGFTPPHERFTPKRALLPSTPVFIEVGSPQRSNSALTRPLVAQSDRFVAGVSDLREDRLVTKSPRQRDRAVVEVTRPQETYSPQPQPAVVQSDRVGFEAPSLREGVVTQMPPQSDRAVVRVTHPQDNYSPRTPFIQSGRVTVGTIDTKYEFMSQKPLQSSRAFAGVTRPMERYYEQATALRSGQDLFGIVDHREGYMVQASVQNERLFVESNTRSTRTQDTYAQEQNRTPGQTARPDVLDSRGFASQTPARNVPRTIDPTFRPNYSQERYFQKPHSLGRRNTVASVAVSQEMLAPSQRTLVGNRSVVGFTPPQERLRQGQRPLPGQDPVVEIVDPQESFVHQGHPLPMEPPSDSSTAPRQIPRATLTEDLCPFPGREPNMVAGSQGKFAQEDYALGSSNKATCITTPREREARMVARPSGQDPVFTLVLPQETLVQGPRNFSNKGFIGAFSGPPDRVNQELPTLRDGDLRGTRSPQWSSQELNSFLVTNPAGGITTLSERSARDLLRLPHGDEATGTLFQERSPQDMYTVPREDNVQRVSSKGRFPKDAYHLRNTNPISDIKGLQERSAQENPPPSNENKVQATISQETPAQNAYFVPHNNIAQGPFSRRRFVQEAYPHQSTEPITATTGIQRTCGQEVPILGDDNFQFKFSPGLTPQHLLSRRDNPQVKCFQEGLRPLRPLPQRDDFPTTGSQESYTTLQPLPIAGVIRTPSSQGFALPPSLPRGGGTRSPAALTAVPPLSCNDDIQAIYSHEGIEPMQSVAQNPIAQTPFLQSGYDTRVKQSKGFAPTPNHPADISDSSVRIANNQEGLYPLPPQFPVPSVGIMPTTPYQEGSNSRWPWAPILGAGNIQVHYPQEGPVSLSSQAPFLFSDGVRGIYSQGVSASLQPQTRVLREVGIQTTLPQESVDSLPPTSHAPLAPIPLAEDIRDTQTREGLALLPPQASILRNVETYITRPHEWRAQRPPLFPRAVLARDSLVDDIQVARSQEGPTPLQLQDPAARDDVQVAHLQEGVNPPPIQDTRAPPQFSGSTRAEEGPTPLRPALDKPVARKSLPWLSRTVAYAETSPFQNKDCGVVGNGEYPQQVSLGDWVPNLEEAKILPRAELEEEQPFRNNASARLGDQHQGPGETQVEALKDDAQPICDTDALAGDANRTLPSRPAPELRTSISAGEDRPQMTWSREVEVVTDANATVRKQADAMISPKRRPLPWLRNKRTSYAPEPQTVAIENIQNKSKLGSLTATETDDDTSQALQLYHVCTAHSIRCQQCYPSPEASPVLKPVIVEDDPGSEKRRQDNNIFGLLQPEFVVLPSISQSPHAEEGTSNFDRKVFQGLHVATAAASDDDIDKWIEEAIGVSIRKFLADLSVFEGLGVNTLANIAKRASRDRRTNIKAWEAAREKRVSETGKSAEK